jgi:hypothetical protein
MSSSTKNTTMDGQLRIREPFTEQYTLIIDSDLMAINAKMQSKTQIRWDFSVLKVNEVSIEIRLLLLDHALLEANNPLVREIANITKVFSRLYNELHLIIDHRGKVTDVLNMHIILDKWAQVKAEMLPLVKHTPDIQNVINLNDSIFQDPKKLIEGIQASEFFMVYFNHLFGNNLPYINKNLIRPNFFNTVNAKWQMDIGRGEPVEGSQPIMKFKLHASAMMQGDFSERAYGQFADKLDIKKLVPDITEKATYKINYKTGAIVAALVDRDELTGNEALYTKTRYSLMGSTVYREYLQQGAAQAVPSAATGPTVLATPEKVVQAEEPLKKEKEDTKKWWQL